MKTIPVEKAVELIPDGASLMIGGFMAVGSPEKVIDELVHQGKRDLTVIANDTAMPGIGIGKLVKEYQFHHDLAADQSVVRDQGRNDRPVYR